MLRVKELDVLRGFAALNVVIFHYTAKFRLNFGHSYSAIYDWELGRFGVELFFTISGFVIFMSLKEHTTLRIFASKRFKRLYPEYWICVCITFLLLRLAADPQLKTVDPTVFILNLTMVQGIFDIRSVDGVYWSLIPELIFYCTIGALFYLGQLGKIRILGAVWLSIMILHGLVTVPFGAYFLNLQYGMFFMAGMLFYNLKYEPVGIYDHLLIVLSFIAAMCVHHGWTYFYVYLLIYLVFYLFVYGGLSMLSWKPFLFLGYISYPLYLIHQNVGFLLMRILAKYISSDFLILLLTVSAMIILAWFIMKFSKMSMRLIQNRLSNPKISTTYQI